MIRKLKLKGDSSLYRKTDDSVVSLTDLIKSQPLKLEYIFVCVL